MPHPHAVIDTIVDLSPVQAGAEAQALRPGAEVVTVALSSGRRGLLDVTDPRSAIWATVLRSRRAAGEPVYLEIDPETGLINELLLSRAVGVESVSPQASGDVDVLLRVSAAVHHVRRSNPDFTELLARLRAALRDGTTVLVTETPDSHDIIDVRPAPSGPEPAPEPRLILPLAEEDIEAIDLAQAVSLFGSVAETTCDPQSSLEPCIPFLYPDDGCWARAHEMCRLIADAGATPAKMWIYSGPDAHLHVRTGNHPDCEVTWDWHVAPTVTVSLPGGDETMVIDPSLFTEPVRVEHWKSVQSDPTAVCEASDASVFTRGRGGQPDDITLDPAYSATKQILQHYRDELMKRAADPGPPPYAACRADVYLRDNLQDSGAEPLADGGISASPDINHFRQPLADPDGALGSPAAQARSDLSETIEIGQTNFIYLRLQNRGMSAAPVDADLYYSVPSTLPTPTEWIPIGSLTTPPVVPGEFKVAGPIPWESIPKKGHYCFVAVIGNASDPKPSLSAVHTADDFYALIRQSNNVTWKNFDTDDVFAGGSITYDFLVQGWPRTALRSDLVLDLSKLPSDATVEFRLLARLAAGASVQGMTKVKTSANHVTYRAQPGKAAAICGMPLRPSDRSVAILSVTTADNTSPGAYEWCALQRAGGQELGRVTRRLIVGDFPYVGNSRSAELHVANCTWVLRMRPRHRIPYRDTALALRRGLNGCRFCLPEIDTGLPQGSGVPRMSVSVLNRDRGAGGPRRG
jgi:Glutaminase